MFYNFVFFIYLDQTIAYGFGDMDNFVNSPLPVFSTAAGDQSAVGSCFVINNPAPNALNFDSNVLETVNASDLIVVKLFFVQAKGTSPSAVFRPLFRHVNKVVVVKPRQRFTVVIPSAGTSQTPAPVASAAPSRTSSPFDNVSPPPPVPTPLPLNVFVKSTEMERNPKQHSQANVRLLFGLIFFLVWKYCRIKLSRRK